MKLCVLGAGRIGLVIANGLADLGHEILCYDTDQEKICLLNDSTIPFYEPGLKDLAVKNFIAQKIQFSHDLQATLEFSSVLFVAIGTGKNDFTSPDQLNLETAIADFANPSTDYTFILKSTVAPGTAQHLQKKWQNKKHRFISNPEFLSQGQALSDFFHPRRIVVGAVNKMDFDLMRSIYAPLLEKNKDLPYIEMDNTSAEITKIAANSFLASRLSLMNEVNRLAYALDANIEAIEKGIGADARIGAQYLQSGLGYGGSCLSKDTETLAQTLKKHELENDFVKSINITNLKQIDYVYRRIQKIILSGPILIWGASYKKDTDDLRNSPAWHLIQKFAKNNQKLFVYDPYAYSEIDKKAQELKVFSAHIQLIKNFEECFARNDFYSNIIITTDWDQFKLENLKPEQIQTLKNKTIFDTRRLWNKNQAQSYGLNYYAL